MGIPRDTDRVIARTIELLGGPERARQVTDAEFGEMVTRWNQDTDVIGRILRSHLYVEHYLRMVCSMHPSVCYLEPEPI